MSSSEEKTALDLENDPLVEVPHKSRNELRRKSEITSYDIKRMVIRCTSCSGLIKHDDIVKHFRLNVIICKKCYDFYGTSEFSVDEGGSYKYCTWCGNGGILFFCDYCPNAFCRTCIRRNFGQKEISNVSKGKWECYICEPESLEPKAQFCQLVLSYNKDVEKTHAEGNKPLIKSEVDEDPEIEEVCVETKINQPGCSSDKSERDDWFLPVLTQVNDSCKYFHKKFQNINASPAKSLKHMITKMEDVIAAHKTKLGQIAKDLSERYLHYLEMQLNSEKRKLIDDSVEIADMHSEGCNTQNGYSQEMSIHHSQEPEEEFRSDTSSKSKKKKRKHKRKTVNFAKKINWDSLEIITTDNIIENENNLSLLDNESLERNSGGIKKKTCEPTETTSSKKNKDKKRENKKSKFLQNPPKITIQVKALDVENSDKAENISNSIKSDVGNRKAKLSPLSLKRRSRKTVNTKPKDISTHAHSTSKSKVSYSIKISKNDEQFSQKGVSDTFNEKLSYEKEQNPANKSDKINLDLSQKGDNKRKLKMSFDEALESGSSTEVNIRTKRKIGRPSKLEEKNSNKTFKKAKSQANMVVTLNKKSTGTNKYQKGIISVESQDTIENKTSVETIKNSAKKVRQKRNTRLSKESIQSVESEQRALQRVKEKLPFDIANDSKLKLGVHVLIRNCDYLIPKGATTIPLPDEYTSHSHSKTEGVKSFEEKVKRKRGRPKKTLEKIDSTHETLNEFKKKQVLPEDDLPKHSSREMKNTGRTKSDKRKHMDSDDEFKEDSHAFHITKYDKEILKTKKKRKHENKRVNSSNVKEEGKEKKRKLIKEEKVSSNNQGGKDKDDLIEVEDSSNDKPEITKERTVGKVRKSSSEKSMQEKENEMFFSSENEEDKGFIQNVIDNLSDSEERKVETSQKKMVNMIVEEGAEDSESDHEESRKGVCKMADSSCENEESRKKENIPDAVDFSCESEEEAFNETKNTPSHENEESGKDKVSNVVDYSSSNEEETVEKDGEERKKEETSNAVDKIDSPSPENEECTASKEDTKKADCPSDNEESHKVAKPTATNAEYPLSGSEDCDPDEYEEVESLDTAE